LKFKINVVAIFKLKYYGTVDKSLYDVHMIRMYSQYTVHPLCDSLEHVAATPVATLILIDLQAAKSAVGKTC